MNNIDYAKAYINAGIEERKKKVDKILPSPFFYEPEFKDIEILKDDIQRMKIFKGFYVKSGYTQISVNCLEIIDELADNPNIIRFEVDVKSSFKINSTSSLFVYTLFFKVI